MNLWHKMNLPNKVTMVRFLMVPVFVLVVSLWHGWAADLLAGLLFIVAANGAHPGLGCGADFGTGICHHRPAHGGR